MQVCIGSNLSLLAATAWSQSKTVTGKVTSEDDGSGIPGVNVLEKGTTNGTVTDANGGYSITTSSDATLVFSFVGYESQEVAVGNQSAINVNLKLDVTSLNEVVVIGYGTQEKKELTSAVTSVKSEDFNRGTVNDPAQLLQGKVAGLNIAKAGNDPNGGYNIRIRGIATFGANTEPLVVIDGIIGGSLNSVDPNDIASIDVLKDGSAAAIYGSRGGSGVILITTKTGKAGRFQVEYNGSAAVEDIGRTIKVMTADEYRQLSGAKDFGIKHGLAGRSYPVGKLPGSQFIVGWRTRRYLFRGRSTTVTLTVLRLIQASINLMAVFNLTQKALKDKATFTVILSTTRKEAEYGFLESLVMPLFLIPRCLCMMLRLSTASETRWQRLWRICRA